MIEFALAVIRNHYVFLKINLKSFMQRSVPVQLLCEMLAAVSRYYFYILHGLLLFPPMTSSVRAPSYSLAQNVSAVLFVVTLILLQHSIIRCFRPHFH